MSKKLTRFFFSLSIVLVPSVIFAMVTLLYDDFDGTIVSSNYWHIPTWVSPTDGTYVGRTQFRCTQNSPLPAASNSNALITVETYNPTGFSFYGTDLISNQQFALVQSIDIKVRAKMDTSTRGIVGGIFLYALKPGSQTLHDEIDFELITNLPNQVQTNIYSDEPLGTGNPQSASYTSGSITDYHIYEIQWQAGAVNWFVDGNLIRTETSNVPAGPMYFHLNMWVPDSSFSDAYDPGIQPTSSADSDQVFQMLVDSVAITSPYQLSVQGSGDGSGTITSSPDGINCGSTCSGNFGNVTQVTLSAALNSGSSFAGWAGCESVQGTTCVVNVSTPQLVTANFVSSSDSPSSFVYGNFGSNGIWMWYGTNWGQITSSNPVNMAASGFYLYGNFGPGGIWVYDGTPNSWTQLSAAAPVNIAASSSTLYGNFGPVGIWQYNGTPFSWTQITASVPVSIAASSSTVYGNFGPGGIWQYNGTPNKWTQLTASVPVSIAASSSTLYGNFGLGGIWQYNGTPNSWTQLTASPAVSIAVSGSTLYGNFGSGGIWVYNGTPFSWTQITASVPVSITASSSTLYGNFGSGGIWVYLGTPFSWTQITPSWPTSIMAPQ